MFFSLLHKHRILSGYIYCRTLLGGLCAPLVIGLGSQFSLVMQIAKELVAAIRIKYLR